MAASVLKRKVARTSQYLCETFDETRSSWLGSDFLELRKKISIYNKFIAKVHVTLRSCLRPNPFMRVKTEWMSSYLRMSGRRAAVSYAHGESILGHKFATFGEDLDDPSLYATALKETRQCFQKLTQIKDILELDIRSTTLNPLMKMEEELEEITRQLRKFDRRPLDYDYNRQNINNITPEDF